MGYPCLILPLELADELLGIGEALFGSACVLFQPNRDL